MPKLDADYWNQRYLAHDTPWDIGRISTPLQHLFEQLTDPDIRLLIPGAGRAHEAIYLHRKGFRQVWVCDWAPEAFSFLRKQAPDFPEDHLIVRDFFSLQDTFDILIEQTFFSALPPGRRPDYVQKAWQLLRPNGYLAGLLFNEQFDRPGPPFGGSRAEYEALFQRHFYLEEWHVATDSIAPRSGRELFLRLRKKDLPLPNA